MADSGRLDELKRKFDENPRRYFAPLANEYRKAGDTDRAIELCRAYLPQQPSHMSGYIVYGQSLFDSGRGDEATAVFKQALTLDPENIIALRYLGDISRGAGDSAAAMRWYGKVLELDPRNEEVAGYITALASPSVRPIPRVERAAPPTIRPEPEHDPAAVDLSDLVGRPDAPQPGIMRAFSGAVADEPTHAGASATSSDIDDAMVIVQQSFEVLTWPNEASAEPEAGAADGEAHGVTPQAGFAPAVGTGDVGTDVGSDVDDSGISQEHDLELEREARTFADFLPVEPSPFAPEEEPVQQHPMGFSRGFEGASEDTGVLAHADEYDDSSPPADQSPFLTETMADLYAQQGMREDALAIYRQLAARSPDARLERRIAELEGRAPAQPETASDRPIEAASEPTSERPPTGRVAAAAEAVAGVLVGAVADLITGVITGGAGDDGAAASPDARSLSAAEPEAATASAAAEREPPAESVRDFFARIGAAHADSHPFLVADAQAHPAAAAAGDSGLASIFGTATSRPADLAAAESLAGAFGGGRGGQGND